MFDKLHDLILKITYTVLSFFTIGVAHALGVYFINVLGACISAMAVAACAYFTTKYLQEKYPFKKKNNDERTNS